jgi:hypothetical protein
MWHRRDPYETELVIECEAYLGGTFAEVLHERGHPVPVWAWVNLLAHGDDAALREASSLLPMIDDRGPATDWWRARSFLAGEVLALIGHDPRQLAGLQREVLVPLELDLASRRAVGRWTPRDLATAVLEVLPGQGAPPARR